MNKHYIKVPQGIQYISEWKEYVLPKGQCIVDKGVTGCGYTEYCLTNSENVVLCSPRKLLLENKRDQHKGDLNILYLENRIEDYKDTVGMKDRVKDHIHSCEVVFQKPIKFMVTYDSAHYIVESLKKSGRLEDFYFIVDEFQSIFLDSHFKAEVENDFLEVIQYCPDLLYLSATPMLDKYLEKLPEFMNLPFYYLDWSETGCIEQVIIERKNVRSLYQECGKIIQDYLSDKFPIALDNTGKPVESKEAVFYFNSVAEILRICKTNGLTLENTTILCSDTPDNQTKLKRLKFKVGRIPVKGEPRTMFTFCTSATYMGVDFYSDIAKSYVFSDPNLDHLALDISIDLPQIVGRQRNRNNPFKNNIGLFYKTKRKDEELTKEKFNKLQEDRRKSTKSLLDGFMNLTSDQQTNYLKKLKSDIQVSQYSGDFVSISKVTNFPVYNSLIELADERAWEVSQEDYQDSINVTRALEDKGFIIGSQIKSEDEVLVDEFLDKNFFSTGVFTEKLKAYCEFSDTYSNFPEILRILNSKIKNSKFKIFYDYFGTSGCKANSYQESTLRSLLGNSTKEEKLKAAIVSTFKAGDRYTSRYIKQTFQKFYDKLGITKKAKATDIKEYFDVEETKITNHETGKRDLGFKLN